MPCGPLDSRRRYRGSVSALADALPRLPQTEGIGVRGQAVRYRTCDARRPPSGNPLSGSSSSAAPSVAGAPHHNLIPWPRFAVEYIDDSFSTRKWTDASDPFERIRTHLTRSLHDLIPAGRIAFENRYFKGKSYAEIARVVKYPPSSLVRLLSTSFRELGEYFDRLGYREV
jgi:hypothetical protein